MVIEKFEDIISWQKSKSLTVELYKILDGNKDNNFKWQILRASVSIMNNIAEGFERKTNKEFTQFLYVAKGSAAEVRSMLYLALELKYITDEQYNKLFNEVIIISKLISNFIKTL
ncbi:MAG: four helix bundle protein [Ignavibacteriae bacterium]|nr:four helix bundle protein [Ignavibacteriota bacterium]